MSAYPTYALEDLMRVTGRVESDFNAGFVPEALKQATLLFKIGTCLSAFPDVSPDSDLAEYAILFMADAIEGSQPYQKVLRNPFSSETIGSYSYSKLQSAVSAGLPTGVSFFDLAIAQLSVCDTQSNLQASGGYNVFEQHKSAHDGYGVYLGPAEMNGNFDGETFDPPEVV